MSTTLELVRELSGHRELYSDRSIVSPSRQEELGAAYLAMPERGESAWPWQTMADELAEQRDALERHGFTFEVTECDPYASAVELFADVDENRHVATLATSATGSHPFWTDSENDTFRAVHDVFGHYASQRGFDRHGEEAAYRRHALMFSELAGLAMATETRGQNAAMIATGAFQAERLAILPARWRQTGSLAPLIGELRAANDQAQAMHAATFGKGF